jgi:hypothetical protein
VPLKCRRSGRCCRWACCCCLLFGLAVGVRCCVCVCVCVWGWGEGASGLYLPLVPCLGNMKTTRRENSQSVSAINDVFCTLSFFHIKDTLSFFHIKDTLSFFLSFSFSSFSSSQQPRQLDNELNRQHQPSTS